MLRPESLQTCRGLEEITAPFNSKTHTVAFARKIPDQLRLLQHLGRMQAETAVTPHRGRRFAQIRPSPHRDRRVPFQPTSFKEVQIF